MSQLTAFEPHAEQNARLLVLGSMPGITSLKIQQYYAHPRNAFWPIILSLYGSASDPLDYDQKLKILSTQRIALWDVLKHCERKGSLDSSIKKDSTVCNDFIPFLNNHSSIRKILLNGKTAERLFVRHVLPGLEPEKYTLCSLPSTSPAMATLNLDGKKTLWHKALVD